MQRDTLGTLNRYAYAAGNPARNVDPSGHWSERGPAPWEQVWQWVNVTLRTIAGQGNWDQLSEGWDVVSPPGYDTVSASPVIRATNATSPCSAAHDIMERSRAVQTYNGTLTPEQLRQIAAIEDAAERLAALEAAYGSMPQPGEHVPSWTDKHVNDEMASRGWTAQDIDDILADPLLVIPTRDQRNIDQALGGGKRDDPATAYYRASNDYVVRNDRTGEIIQVSDRNKLDWEPRFPPSGLDFGDLE